MLNRQILSIILCITCLSASAQKQPAARPVESVITSFFEALSNNDSAGLTKTCTPAITIVEHDVIWNRDSLLHIIKINKTKAYTRKNKFDFIKTEINGQSAWTTYRNEAIITINGQTITKRWLESAVLIWKDHHWVITLLHSTRVNVN